MSDHLIQVRDLYVSYYKKLILENICFTSPTGRLIGIVGPNGAGKSTLIKAMLGLIPKDKGSITFLEKNIKQVQKQIAYVPQRSNIDWDFPITVLDTVLLGTYPNLGLFRRPKQKERALAASCLAKVGLESFAHKQISELSGGQQQRVFLARALAQGAEFFFLDEPFVGIDVGSEEVIIQLLRKLRDEGKTIFVVHHDLSKVLDYFDDLILINQRIIGFGPVEETFQQELLEKTFERQLFLEPSIAKEV